MLTACNPAPLHVAIAAARGAEGGSNLGRSSPERRSPILAPSRWERRAHRRGGTALRGWRGAVAAGRLGQSAACPAKRGSREGEQGGDGLSSFLAAMFGSGLTLQRAGENAEKAPTPFTHTHTSQIIFLSGRKRPQILRHDDSAGLYSIWKK